MRCGLSVVIIDFEEAELADRIEQVFHSISMIRAADQENGPCIILQYAQKPDGLADLTDESFESASLCR